MRILPRLPLYTAVAALAATCTLVMSATPASAQDLEDWAANRGENLDPVPCDAPAEDGAGINGKPWNVDAAGLPLAHEHSTGVKPDGTPVKVAVIDSGTEDEHATFNGNVLPGADPYDPGSRAQCDRHGHGTAVAGIIAGGHDEQGFVGVAPEAQIVPFRLYPTGEEGGNNDEIPDQIADTIDTAVAAGVDVINISIAVLPSDALAQAVEDAWDAGVVIVAATGNERKQMDDERNDPDKQVYYPANYPKVIAVGATDINGALYAEENFGENMDLVAPGENLTVPSNGTDGYLSGQSGTSFAAPHVAGAVALLIAKYPDLATPQWITDRLIATATPPADGFNQYQGHGLLNIPKALTASIDADEEEEEPSDAAVVEPRGIQPFPPDYDPLASEKTIAWASLGVAALLITLVLVLKKIIPRGRRRGWRPGSRRSDNLPATVETAETP
ncbi:S8 family peptidase [Glycomyces tarimensis]